MNYPKCLYQRQRNKLEDSKIKNSHYMYMRNKPGFSWKKEENLPDFSQIPSDQSFNWCKYSIPIWVRFNEKMNYLLDYAVVGIKSEVIRYSKKYNIYLENDMYNIIHKPLRENYSHCELAKANVTKAQGRAFRMMLKHNCTIYVEPNEEFNFFRKLYHLLVMVLYKLI